MAKWRVRCSRCDARRVLNRHPNEYKRIPPCRRCGHKWYYPVKRPQATCRCSAYWFPHRKGSKCCEDHPKGLYHQAVRQGITDEDTLLDVLLECPGKPVKASDPDPF